MPERLRFRRAQRLLHARDFERVYREGSRARGAYMTVAAAPNGLAHARLGLSVGKVVWKRAVKRNRVRRILREAFRLEQAALPAGADLVVIGSTPRVELELAEARRELVLLATKAWKRYLAKAAAP